MWKGSGNSHENHCKTAMYESCTNHVCGMGVDNSWTSENFMRHKAKTNITWYLSQS